MNDDQHKTCAGTTKDGSPCGAKPGQGEEFCYRHREAEVVSISERQKSAEQAFASGDMTAEEYGAWLEAIMRGDVTETKTTARGDTYESEAQVKDKLTAGRELRALRGWRGNGNDDMDDALETLADRIREKLGIA